MDDANNGNAGNANDAKNVVPDASGFVHFYRTTFVDKNVLKKINTNDVREEEEERTPLRFFNSKTDGWSAHGDDAMRTMTIAIARASASIDRRRRAPWRTTSACARLRGHGHRPRARGGGAGGARDASEDDADARAMGIASGNARWSRL